MDFLTILLVTGLVVVYVAIICAVVIATVSRIIDKSRRPFLGLALILGELTFFGAFMVWVIQYLG